MTVLICSVAFLICAAMNAVTAWRNVQRAREQRDLLHRLIIFAGWLTTEESGAPANVRNAARQALPPGAVVDVSTVQWTSRRVH